MASCRHKGPEPKVDATQPLHGKIWTTLKNLFPHSPHFHHPCGCHHCCSHGTAPAKTDTDVGAMPHTVIYHIPRMESPAEEALIRKKLGGIKGVTGMEFNLTDRLLTVRHILPNDTIKSDLLNIGMDPVQARADEVAKFSITGMDCPEEEKLIRSRLARVPGISELRFNLLDRSLRVEYQPGNLPAIIAALRELNMGATLLEDGHKGVIPETRIPWKKLAVAGALGAMSELFDIFQQWHVPFLGLESCHLVGYSLLQIFSLILALGAIALAGLKTYRKGWQAIRSLNLNINALMTVAVTGAVLLGQLPEAAMVMVLFNLSEAIEAKALDKARHAIQGLLALAPEQATVLRPDGSWEDMDVHQVPVGSHVRVKPGERIALDGIVLSGSSTVNQAPITGESMPVAKACGDTLYAGTINESGSFEFQVTAAANDSTLARIIHAVEEAQSTRAPIQRFVDVFAKYYTPAVFLLAVLTAFGMPLFCHTAWTQSIYTSLVLLLIGCPCALVISTPVTIVSGMAAATRHGILVKGGVFLEQTRRLNCLALDKTGTITQGKPIQTDFIPLEDAAGLEQIAASLASRSDHPVSRAITGAASTTALVVDDFKAIPGQGICGSIEGRKWCLGNQKRLLELGYADGRLLSRINTLEGDGKTVVALVGESGPVALFAVADAIRPASREAIGQLKAMGVETWLLTGDNEHTAAAIARAAGVDEYRANLLPQGKLEIIEELEKSGKYVGMVGDGINDAPALAKADIGFAMARGGTDTAIETADVALMEDDLRKIPRFIRLSRATYAILVENISLALGIKALFFILTFAGYASMWMAVFADVGAALLVVANGLRATRK